MSNVLNKAAHFGIGFATGLFAHKPAAIIATAGFLGYQGLEVASKHDKGYPEVREWAYGLATGLVLRTVLRAILHAKKAEASYVARQNAPTVQLYHKQDAV